MLSYQEYKKNNSYNCIYIIFTLTNIFFRSQHFIQASSEKPPSPKKKGNFFKAPSPSHQYQQRNHSQNNSKPLLAMLKDITNTYSQQSTSQDTQSNDPQKDAKSHNNKIKSFSAEKEKKTHLSIEEEIRENYFVLQQQLTKPIDSLNAFLTLKNLSLLYILFSSLNIIIIYSTHLFNRARFLFSS